MDSDSPFDLSPGAAAASTPPKRPAVILVFAILTFIMSAFLMLTASGLMMFTEVIPGFIPTVFMLTQIGKIVGASFMIAMRRFGFYLYAACELIFYIPYVTLEFYTEEMKEFIIELYERNPAAFSGIGNPEELFEQSGGSGFIGWAITIAFTVAWIAVYGSQLKKMK